MSSAAASAPSVRPVALVIGGGIAGCTAALFLRRAGVEARVFEAYPHVADNVVGGLGLASNGMNVLRSLGLAEKLAARSSPSTAFQFANDSGKILGTAPLNGKQKYGVDGVACTRLALHQVLHAECEAQGIIIQYSKRLTEFDEDDQGITARFEDGTSEQGAFLVAADGLHSRVRNILFPSVKPEYIGLVGYGGGVPLEDLTEAQRAACPPRGTMRFIFGPLGFFGMSDFGRDEKTGKVRSEHSPCKCNCFCV
jgi:2-polyprenyl-6-methoxyphenol hydroxylase-like FAD-dependent oxidoreductase